MTTEQKAPGTAVQRADDNPKGIIATLEQDRARGVIEPLLPDGVSYDRALREVYLASRKNPEILQCSVPSVISAVADALITGGTIGVDVHLVPFNVNVAPRGQPKQYEKRLQAITDYKYKAELVVRTGAAQAVDAKCVYQKEHFRYEEGLHLVLEHHPILDPKERGPMIGAYAIARLSFNNAKIQWMHLSEIEEIRAGSKQWNPEKVRDCPYWYACKTVIHRLVKLLPKNARLAKFMGQWAREEELEFTDELPPETGAIAALGAGAPISERPDKAAPPVAADVKPPAPANTLEDDLEFDRELAQEERE